MIAEAFKMLEYSYAPYSHFKVGAALLSANGMLYGGCNVENAAYGPSNCAERTAVFRAVACGERDFSAICALFLHKTLQFADFLVEFSLWQKIYH
jgi:cytidine deaminase